MLMINSIYGLIRILFFVFLITLGLDFTIARLNLKYPFDDVLIKIIYDF